VGDVHQPLHSTTRVSKGMKTGGGGGNSHTVCSNDKNCKTLHSFWDGVVGNTNDAAAVVEFTDDLDAPDPNEVKNLDVSEWTLQSFELAKANIYVSPIKAGRGPSNVTSEYRNNSVELARDQISLAGARLAGIINSNLK